MTSSTKTRPQLMLLVSRFAHPHKDLVATTLASMCKLKRITFDVYYAAESEGGIFSTFGSSLYGGRHHGAIARLLAQFDTTVVRLGTVSVFASLFEAAASVLDTADSLIDLYCRVAADLDLAVPQTVVAIQTQGLPPALRHGIAQYAFVEVVQRQAWAVPVELSEAEVCKLTKIGVSSVAVVAMADAPRQAWMQHGCSVTSAETVAEDDSIHSFTFRVARRWLEQSKGVDFCEPVTASYWLPYCVRENRVQVFGECKADAISDMVPLVKATGDRVVYGRYAGGPVPPQPSKTGMLYGGDEFLFALYQHNITFQVIEPRRPVLLAFSQFRHSLPQPEATPYDHEPTDDVLRYWAREGHILATMVFHSGEMSHNDAMLQVMELSALTKVKVGIGVQYQRYAFDPDGVEPMQIPVEEGGVLGLCEPVLHGSGMGIMSEALADPSVVAGMMKEARDRIAAMSGHRFAPCGVFCNLDFVPGKPQESPVTLFRAIKQAGFSYVISNACAGEPRVLYRDGDFVAINMWYGNVYPSSPFIRVGKVEQIADMERRLTGNGRAGWIIAVIDAPIYAYSCYLVAGRSHASMGNPSFENVRLGQFFDYIRYRGETGKLISATPHVIARYACILNDLYGT